MDIYLEIVGYIGTILVVVSMMMSSLTKLRIVNICGSIISTVYAIIIICTCLNVLEKIKEL